MYEMWYLTCTDNSYLLRRALTQDTWARSGGGTATDFEKRAGAGELRRTVVPALSAVRERATLAAPYTLHIASLPLAPNYIPVGFYWLLVFLLYMVIKVYLEYCTRRRCTRPALFKIISFYN